MWPRLQGDGTPVGNVPLIALIDAQQFFAINLYGLKSPHSGSFSEKITVLIPRVKSPSAAGIQECWNKSTGTGPAVLKQTNCTNSSSVLSESVIFHNFGCINGQRSVYGRFGLFTVALRK